MDRKHCGSKLEPEVKIKKDTKRKPRFNFNITAIVITIILIGIAAGIILVDYSQENKIQEIVQLGNKYLKEENFKAARREFQAAISMDTKNKQIYLQIKDIYLENNRLDDAVYIIKTAINNKITDKDIISDLDTIKKSFQVINVEDNVNQNDFYNLPKEVSIKINEEEVKAAVNWGNSKVETAKVGAFIFEGISEEYERPISLTLKVIPRIISIKDINASVTQGQEFKLPAKVQAVMSDESLKEVEVKWNLDKADTGSAGVYNYVGVIEGYEKKLQLNLTVIAKPTPPKVVTKSDKIGYIKKVYEKGGKRYLQIDEVQFLTGNTAIEAAKKDGNAGYDENTHKYFVYNDYYIVNSNPRLRDYEIPSTASINMLGFLVDSNWDNASNKPVTYNQFKSIINDSDAGDLCHIYIENEIVVKIEGQYVP